MQLTSCEWSDIFLIV